MDLSVPNHYPGGIPKAAGQWEAYILNQQEDLSHPRVSRRRQTIPGIPDWSDFVVQHEERAAKSKKRAKEHHTRARRDSVFGSDVKFSGVSLNESLGDDSASPHSFSSPTTPSFRRISANVIMPKKHHRHSSGSKHRRCSSGTKAKTHPSFKPAADLPSVNSPASFEDLVRKDKARFYAQQQSTKTQTRFKSHFDASKLVPEPTSSPPPKRQARESSHLTLFDQWRHDCDRELGSKATMTHVPAPLIDTCNSCATDSIVGSQPVPIACQHSLDQLLRTGIPKSFQPRARTQAYLAILKTERQRWHTDRFGACPDEHKPRILTAAQHLFILINALYEKEKAKLKELPPDEVLRGDFDRATAEMEEWWKEQDTHSYREAW